MRKNQLQMNRGYIALIGVLISAALLLLVGVGSSIRGVDALKTISAEEASFRALILADSCAEEALLRLKADLSYGGNETIMIDGGSVCRILPLSGSGNTDRIVLAEGSEREFVKRVRVTVTEVNPSLRIEKWETIP